MSEDEALDYALVGRTVDLYTDRIWLEVRKTVPGQHPGGWFSYVD